MLKNKRNYFTLNICISIFLGIVATLIFTIGFVNPSIKLSSDYNYEISESEDTLYDYRVYSPTKIQIDEMLEQTFIETVFGYYTSAVSIQVNGEKIESNAMYSDNITNLEISAYNEHRVKEGLFQLEENGVFIDQKIAKNLKVTIGDTINVTIKNVILSLKITAIFEDNTFYENGSIFFILTEQMILDLKVKTDSYSAVLIDAKNDELTYEYLKKYIPLAEMLSRDYFSSNSEYEAYVDNFMKRDYSSRIYVKKQVLSNTIDVFSHKLVESKNLILIGSIIYTIIMLGLLFKVIFAFKYVNNYSRRVLMSIPTNEFRRNFLISNTIAYIISLCLIAILVSSTLRKYGVYDDYLDNLISQFGLFIISSFIVINIIEQISITKINPKMKKNLKGNIKLSIDDIKKLNQNEIKNLTKEELNQLNIESLKVIAEKLEINIVKEVTKSELITIIQKNHKK